MLNQAHAISIGSVRFASPRNVISSLHIDIYQNDKTPQHSKQKRTKQQKKIAQNL